MTVSAIPITLVESLITGAPVSSTRSADTIIRESIFAYTKKQSNVTSVYKEVLRYLRNIFGEFVVVDEEGKTKVIKAITGVPERAIGDYFKKNNFILPLISIVQTNSDTEPEQRRYYPMVTSESLWDDKAQRAIRIVSLVPRPIKIEYEISIWSNYKEDMDQLVEQIYREFHPSRDLNISFTKYGKVFLDSEFDSTEKEFPDKTERVLTKEFRFIVETHIPYPKFRLTNTGQIERIYAEAQSLEE